MATIRRLIVEVVDARNLLPKDGQGTSSPYAVIDYYGQRKKTRTVIRDLNPTWNQVIEFNDRKEKPSQVFTDMLKLDLFHDKNYGPTRRNNFLGRIRLSSTHFVTKGEEALIYYPLEKKSLLSWVQGEIGLKVFYVDELPLPLEQTIGGGKEVSGEDNSCFECNICLELANDPVVTLCGHLYCGPCIYQWLRVKTSSLDADEQPQNVCPVCKAKISISSLVLLYGRGTVGKYETFLKYFMMWLMMWLMTWLMTWLNFGL